MKFGGWNRKRPYEGLYLHLTREARRRGIPLSITYEDFLLYTMVSWCHYCGGKIFWSQYNPSFRSCATNLDRKDNGQGYTKENCVVCCPVCNRARSNLFTYQEWVVMTAALRTLRGTRDRILIS